MRRYWSWRTLGCGIAGASLLAHGSHKLIDALEASNSLQSFFGSPSALFGAGLVLVATVGLCGATLD